MTPTRAQNRLVILAVLGVLVWCAIVVLPSFYGRASFTDPIENWLLDVRYAVSGPAVPAQDIVIVAIDDATLADEAVAAFSRRALLGLLATRIAQSDAKTLALDVLLADRGDADEDAGLLQALGQVPSVIAAAAVFDDGARAMGRMIWPLDAFRAVAQAGAVNVSTDANGVPRYIPLLVMVDGTMVPSLPLLAALEFTGQEATFETTELVIGSRRVPLDREFNMPLRALGPTGTVQTLSAQVLLDGPAPDRLAGKMVVMGYTATATADRFETPFSLNTPGVEIIASAISQIIESDTLRRDRDTRLWDAVHATVVALASVLVVCLLPLSRGLPAALGVVAVSFAMVTMLFSSGVWLSAALPLTAAAPTMLAAGVLRYRWERGQARRSEQSAASLRRFHSPALVQQLERDPDYLKHPKEQDLVIFFVDLTGFTALSQRLGPEGTQNLLTLFHQLTSETVEAEGGSVFNYMGDGALAVFGLDQERASKAADHALTAAVALVRTLSKAQLEQMPQGTLHCRIGLHKGLATLSRLGAESHQQVTASGDTVNLASRLMEVAKTQSAVIVASGDFCEALHKEAYVTLADTAHVPIRGRDGKIEVFCWSLAQVAKLDQVALVVNKI